MGIHIYNRHDVAKSLCTGVSWSFFSPLLSICKSFSQRGTFGKNYRVNTAVPEGQAGRAGTAEKSNFIEPKWLLPAEDKARKSATDQTSSESVFRVILTTSKVYGSDISDLDAGILLTLIGEHGRCFVHRIPTLVFTETVETSEQTEELCVSWPSHYRFQRGSQDVVTFCGPDLGNLEAVWVAPERGTWRIKDMSAIVFPEQFHKDGRNIIEDTGGKILQYDFVCEELLIGENDNNLAAELKPSKVSEISYDGQLLLGSESMVNGLQAPLGQVRDKGIKEYEALKFSLLGYDAILVTLGSAMAAATGHSEVADGYLVGGLLGFLYLFLLEKAVDQLPAPLFSPLLVSNDKESSVKDRTESIEGRSSTKVNENGTSLFEKNKYWQAGSVDGFRGPLTKFSGILAVSLLIAKSLNTTNNQAISKQMLLAGVAGFLMTKFATILASNVPISLKQAPSFEEEV